MTTKKSYMYFVTFVANGKYGNLQIEYEKKFDDIKDILEIAAYLKNNLSADDVTILFYSLLREEKK